MERHCTPINRQKHCSRGKYDMRFGTHHLLLHRRHSSCWILHSCHPLLLLLHVWDPLLLMRMLRLVLWRWVLIRTVALLHLDLNMISQSPPSPPPPSSSTTTTLKASNLVFVYFWRESLRVKGEERRDEGG